MPNKPRHPCKNCGYLKRKADCPRCGRRPYDGEWRKTSQYKIRDHVRQYGWQCPGLTTGTIDHPPHQTRDLTTDHIDGNNMNDDPTNLRVVCRPLNTMLRHQ